MMSFQVLTISMLLDRSEVKVMSDLAMISAGETPMDVDRVSCFLSAVMGFSPLVFDLTEDAGLNELLTACRVVWENVERDDRLIKKWVGFAFSAATVVTMLDSGIHSL